MFVHTVNTCIHTYITVFLCIHMFTKIGVIEAAAVTADASAKAY